MQKCVNLVDLVKSFQASIYYLVARFGFDTAQNSPVYRRRRRERASQKPKVSPELDQKLAPTRPEAEARQRRPHAREEEALALGGRLRGGLRRGLAKARGQSVPKLGQHSEYFSKILLIFSPNFL